MTVVVVAVVVACLVVGVFLLKEEQNCRLVPLNKNKNLMSRCCLGNFQTNNDPVILEHGAVARLSTAQKPIQIPFFSRPLCVVISSPFFRIRYV